MNKRYFILATLAIIILFSLFYLIGTTKIKIHFNNLEPLKHNLPVYYNGFKLGKSIKIYPNKDYTSTMVDIRIALRDLELPANITASIRRKDKKDYIELNYPKAPALAKVKNNDTIEGTLGSNFEHYLQDQIENGGFDEIKENVNITIKSAGKTFDALTTLLNTLTYILEDSTGEIKNSINNLNITTKNLATSSDIIKKTLEKGYIDNSLNNLQQTTENLSLTTDNTNKFTTGLHKESIKLLNCLISNANIVVNNINEIIIGLGNTLKERFGGLKLFFGKTIR